MNLDISKAAQKFLRKLPPKQEAQVLRYFITLTENPYTPDTKILKGYEPLRRGTVGEYRVVYLIAQQTVRIVIVGKRNDSAVYRLLERKLRR